MKPPFQVRFKDDGSQFVCEVTMDLKESHNLFVFRSSSVNSMFAELLANHAREQQAETFRKVRELAYFQGWKDKASKKQKKATLFSSYPAVTNHRGGCF